MQPNSQLALAVNPYHLGFSMWEHIIEKQGMEAARRICREEDDFGFIRNYLMRELAEKLELFVYEAHDDGDIRIAERDIHAVREAILAPKFNYGAPRIAAKHCMSTAAWSWCTTIRAMAAASI